MTIDLDSLSPEKRELLELLLAEEAGPAVFPLSYTQRGLWFLDRMEPGSPTYILASALRLTGRLDVPAFSRSFEEVVDRHEALRATFSEEDGEPVQVIAPALALRIPRVDLRALPEAAREAETRRLGRQEARRPFDLAAGPLLRVTLLQLGNEEHVALFALHHIAADAWSVGVLIGEVAALYGAFVRGLPSPLPPLPLQYPDWVEWQRELLLGEARDVQLAWWTERLAGAPPLDLPTDRPRPAVQTTRVAALQASASGDLGARGGTTPFMVLLAAFETLLSRIAGQDDFVVGIPIANRRYSELEKLIGLFINTLALRTDLAGGPTFAELLSRVRETTVGAYAHQDLPLEVIIRALGLERDLSRAPLFQVLFQVQNAPAASFELPGLTLAPVELGVAQSADYDLVVTYVETPQGLAGTWVYNTDLFDRPTVARFARSFHTLLAAAVADPSCGVASLPLLPESERWQVLGEWNGAAAPGLPDGGGELRRLFEIQSARVPEAPALAWEKGFLTYRELNRRANRLAHGLRKLGVGPEVLVGLLVERSPAMIVGMLGVLKAGGAYLPLDPSYPAERLDLMLRDAGAALVLTEARLDDPEWTAGESEENPEGGTGPDFPAYVIYTSGSTGTPKGVVALNRGLAGFTRAMAGVLRLGPGDRFLEFPSFSFDASLVSIASTLASGAALVLHRDPTGLSIDELLAFCAAQRVTHLDIPVAFLRQIVQELAARGDRGFGGAPVRALLTGGESLSREALLQWADLVGRDDSLFLSSYGPTETTVTASVFTITAREAAGLARGNVPLGRPLPGVAVLVLDGELSPVPVGVPGEVWIGGAGVARGYLRRPDLTADAFRPDPLSGGAGERIYRTGDRARWLPGGHLEFLGRADHQVKVRGFRIELGEVEAALARHPAVEHSVAVAMGDGGERRLVAYVVPAGTAPEGLARDLRAFLRESLPEAMVPSAVVLLDRLPVTPGGKVDRRALPRPDLSDAPARDWVPPRGEIAETLAVVWARLLGVDRVGADDDFFDLGGHSLLATQLVSRIREVFGVELPLRRLFEAPTLQVLAFAIEAARSVEPGRAAPPVVPVPRDGDLPLSFAQERLWFLDQLQPGQPTYNMPSAVRMTGPLRLAALAGAFTEAVRRHETLRTTFPAVAGRPVQRTAPPTPFPLPVVDLEALPVGEREREAARWTAWEAALPFDLAAGPLLRARLLRLGEGEHLLLATLHHIVSDGWSMGILIRELGAAYQSLALPDLPVQYADWAVWQRQWLQGDVLEAQLAYWRRQLGGDVAVLELPADRPRPAIATFRGDHRSTVLPAALAQSLEALARSEEATLFMTLLAGFDVLLSRLTGQTDVPVGTPVAGRGRGETEGLIGLFLNTLVLRGDLSGDPSFRGLLARLRGTALDAYAHQDVPFERLVEDLQPQRSFNQTPLFQVMLVLQNAPGGELGAGDLTLAPVATAAPTARFDLTLVLWSAGDGLRASAEYRSDLFDGTTVERWLGHFRTLLEGIVADPGRRISGLPLLTPAERDQIARAWNDTAEDLGPPACLHDLFYAQAARTPDAPAVLWKDGERTYGDLARQADRLARHLGAKGVAPGDLVALLLDPSPERVAAVLAVLRAGAAYVPLDPAYPADRLDFMLEDTGAALVLTRETLAAALEEPDGGAVDLPSAAPDDQAYVIYTSGSTGRPKGVVIRHAAAANTVRDVNRRFGVGPADRVFAVSALSFDLSVYDLFGPLAVGGAVVLPEPSPTPDPTAWSAALARHGVTIWDSAPALMDLLVSSGAPLPETLRLVLLSGDWIPVTLPGEIRRRVPGARVISLGGATEGSIWSILYPISDVPPSWTSIPYGRPMANQAFHVLDRAGHLAPVGAAGELHIGGAGVADGYHARPDLTAEKFVPDPFADRPGARLYRTGDLGRRFPDGTIEFLGRRDQQVKIRGFRIELGEIEAVLNAHPAVRESVVLARQEEGLAKSAGLSQARLVGYVVPEPGADFDLSALRTHLAAGLPEHMVPSALVPLESLPLTPNGKVDRRALPAPDTAGQDPDREHVPPRSGAEVAMAGLWRDLLRIERVGAHDDFFDLGGHSLLATQLVSRVREIFGVELPLRRLFEAPTLSALTSAVEAARSEDPALAAPPLVPVPRDREIPLSFAQERLWFLDQLQPGLPTYNIPSALRMTGPLAPAALAAAFTEVVRRHETLRTTFPTAAGRPVQRIAPPAPFPLPVVDLKALPAGEREREAARLTALEAARPFDLANGPLLRAGLLRLGEREHLLLATMHHIVSDGWSMGVFIGELGAAYPAFATGTSPDLPGLPVQYADWAVWQRQWLEGDVLEAQLAWWRRQLGGDVAVLELPADRPRPAVATFRGGQRSTGLPAALAEALEALARREEATLFMTLLAGFDVLLARLTGQTDVPVGTPVAGRSRGEIEGLIGLFLNTLVLRGDLSGDPGFRELLARLRGTALDAYAHQDVPFERLVEDLQPQRSLNQTPLFQVMLVLQNTPEATVGAGDLTLSPLAAPASTSRFDLTLVLWSAGDGLHASAEYRSDLFDGTTVERWLGHFRTLLEGIVADPDLRISGLPLLTPAERDQIVSAWNDTAEDLGPPACLHDLFYAQAARTPDAPAVLWKDGERTYGDLARQAARLARRLRAKGVGPGDLVALLLDPSPERIAAVLAVLRAGAAYVPLDPAYPADRLDFMMEDTGAALLLTREALATALEEPDKGETLDLPSAAPGDRAYVIYTSGSTGRPKGVVIRHAAAVNTVRDVNRRFDVGPADRVFAVSALSFDLSVYDLFGPLAVGGAIVLPEPSPTPDPTAWSAALSRHGVTIWDSAPALMDLLVSSGAPLPETLRLVLLSGDWIPVTLPGEIRRRVPKARVISLGGATEASIWSILYPISDVPPAWTSIPYGRPMANQTFHVLDPAGHPAPVGVAGELHIGGIGVADGYHARPELTAEKFVPDPFANRPGARLYRTGDLGRRFADGTIEFLGRRDHQVKIRGFRIELGEIEAVLNAHPAVRESVVLARQEEGLAKSAGLSQARLVAYVVPEPGAELGLAALRPHLAARLPEHMIPSALVPLESIPLTPNGKVDRRALPAPEAGPEREADFVPPRDGVEETIAALWKDLLKVDRVGAHDNFFALGGHSLLATRVAAALRDAFGVEVPLRTLFEKTTVADLALAVAQLRLEQADATEAARLLETLEGLSDEEVEALLAGEEGELEKV